MTATSVAATDALQQALAAEHAVVYGYGVAGGRLGPVAQRVARAAEQVHRDRRNTLVAAITAAGGEPVAAEAAYRLPTPVTTAADALGLAVRLEEGSAAAWREVLRAAAAGSAERRLALTALTDAAARAARWRLSAAPGRPATVPFPGT